MADKTPTQNEQIAQSDRTLYKEISAGVYALVRGAVLMVGTTEIDATNPLPVSGIISIPANPFSTNDNWAVNQTDTQIEAAPGAGRSLVITDINFTTDTGGSITLVRNTPASVAIWGPFYFSGNGGALKEFRTAVVVPANENIGITSVGAGNHTVSVQGYII